MALTSKFEDIKGVLRRGELKDIQVNGQNKKKDKRTNNNLQNIHIKVMREQQEPH